MERRGRDFSFQNVLSGRKLTPVGLLNGAEEEDSEPFLTLHTTSEFPVLCPMVLAEVSVGQKGLNERHSYYCYL